METAKLFVALARYWRQKVLYFELQVPNVRADAWLAYEAWGHTFEEFVQTVAHAVRESKVNNFDVINAGRTHRRNHSKLSRSLLSKFSRELKKELS